MSALFKNFRLLSLSVSAAALCAVPTLSAETLHEAVNRACINHPDAHSAQLLVLEAGERVKEARSVILPRLDGVVEAGLAEDFNRDDFSIDNSRPLSGQLSLNQPLYLGGRGNAIIKGAKGELKAQKYQSIRQLLGVQFTAIQAYINLSSAKEVLEVRQKNIEALQKRKTESERRFQLGAGTQTDILQAVARIERGQAEIMVAWQDIRREQAAFLEATGALQAGELEYPNLPVMPLSLKAALAKANEVNPDILAAQALIDVASENVRAIQNTFSPELRLIGEASAQRDTVFNGFDRDEASLSLRLNIPFFDGGNSSAAERRGLYARNRSYYERNLSIQRAHESVTNAWTAFEVSNNLVDINKKLVDVASRALAAVRKEVEAGFRPNLDILDAQQELLDAELAYTTSRYNSVLSAYVVKNAMGDFDVGAFDDCNALKPDVIPRPKRKVIERDLGYGIKITTPEKRRKRGPRGK